MTYFYNITKLHTKPLEIVQYEQMKDHITAYFVYFNIGPDCFTRKPVQNRVVCKRSSGEVAKEVAKVRFSGVKLNSIF